MFATNNSIIILNSSNIETQTALFLSELDRLGTESGKAQNLNQAITSVEKTVKSDHIVLVYCNNDIPQGFVRYGAKDLFFYRKNGEIVECRGAPCVLDFYVSDSCQRMGIGLQLFQRLMETIGLTGMENKLAYDRPSPKLVSFLSKHYQMINGDLQPNRFMIFSGFL